MINGLGAAPSLFAQPFPPPAKAGGPVAAPGLQGGAQEKTQGGAQGLLNGPEAPRRAQGLSSASKADGEKKPSSGKPSAGGEELTEAEERQVQDLKQRETEVRAHEAAHSAAGGAFTGATSFEYTVGPDGRRYIVGGEVQIDTAPVRDNPEATIRKMDAVIRAANAPADPSPQDSQVARQAQQARAQAVAQLQAQRQEEREGASGDGEEPQGGLSAPDPAPGSAPDANLSAPNAGERDGERDGARGLQDQILQAIEAYQSPREQALRPGLSV